MMCGIVGFINSQRSNDSAYLFNIVYRMANYLEHRGPDDASAWIDTKIGLALGHRRLSILDLSPAGRQPMISTNGRYVLVANCEIYNHLDLRRELGAYPWRGHSDTETLLAAIERWGLEDSLKKSVGMFALGLWDRHARELALARDRMGEKPLYYGWQGDTFLFGSELKALRCHPNFQNAIDRDVLPIYLRYGYIPAPYAIYRGIRKLLPGTVLRLPATCSKGFLPDPVAYWSFYEVVKSGLAHPFTGSENDAVLELEKRLTTAVGLQMVADVPLGAFLSGGIDSSTVVALMQAQSSKPVKTFTIGFTEQGYNEAEHAKSVANHLGTDHNELYVTPEYAMETIPSLPVLYDEPFGDVSAIPTYIVAQLARQHVKVSLSGDGGDELFGGYENYLLFPALWRRLNRLPTAVWRVVAAFANIIPNRLMNFLGEPLIALRGRMPSIPFSIRLRQVAAAMSYGTDEKFVQAMRAGAMIADEMLRGNRRSNPVSSYNLGLTPVLASLSERMMHFDAVYFLTDDILVKVDRAAMGVGLETRVPLLDHRVVEFAATLPLQLKIKKGKGKWVLRQLLHRYVPESLVSRPKQGFNIPMDIWIRTGKGRQWAEALVDRSRLNREGIFMTDMVQVRWTEHLSGKYNWQGLLWRILMFQAWLIEHRTKTATGSSLHG